MAAHRYGILGQHLGHSQSPQLYHSLAQLDYRIFNQDPSELDSFFAQPSWSGINVTIPHKKAACAYLSSQSNLAARLGNVNTIIKASDGRLYGTNTDYYGILCLLHSLKANMADLQHIRVEDLKASLTTTNMQALILGTGGAAQTCSQVLQDLGYSTQLFGRSFDATDLESMGLRNANLIVNATPVGMYPNTQASPLDRLGGLEYFKKTEGLLDLIYNPQESLLVSQARAAGIPASGGLVMFQAQAALSLSYYLAAQEEQEQATSTRCSQTFYQQLFAQTCPDADILRRAFAWRP